MTQRYISLLAQGALGELVDIAKTASLDDPRIDQWVTKYSWNDRKRDTGVLTALAMAASTGSSRPDQDTDAGELAAALVTAHLDDDDETFDRLVSTWTESLPTERSAVLQTLIRTIHRG